MASFEKKNEFKITFGSYVFNYDTAEELGRMVGESGCNMPCPYEPGHTEYDDYCEAVWSAVDKAKRHDK